MLFFRYSGLLVAQQPLMASVAILAPEGERERYIPNSNAQCRVKLAHALTPN